MVPKSVPKTIESVASECLESRSVIANSENNSDKKMGSIVSVEVVEALMDTKSILAYITKMASRVSYHFQFWRPIMLPSQKAQAHLSLCVSVVTVYETRINSARISTPPANSPPWFPLQCRLQREETEKWNHGKH